MTPKRPDATCLILRAQRIALLQRDVGRDAVRPEHRRERVAVADRHAAQFLLVAVLVLAALAGVALAADAVHRDRQRGVRLGRDGAQRHRAGGKALDDLLRRFDFVERDGACRIEAEFEQAAQRHVALGLIVDDLRVFLVRLVVVRAGRVLQLGDRVRRPHVLFAAHAVLRIRRPRRACCASTGSSPNAWRCRRIASSATSNRPIPPTLLAVPLKYLSTKPSDKTDRLEDLRAAVRHVGRNAHLRHDLLQALADRLGEVVDRLVADHPARHVRGHAACSVSIARYGCTASAP